MKNSNPVGSSTNQRSRYWLGIDGCRAGWCVTKIVERSPKVTTWAVGSLRELAPIIANASRTHIDIPIGLPSRKIPTRECDRLARKLLGGKSSSIFSPPVRKAVGSKTYKKACSINTAETGKAISIQSWNIVPKIREAEEFLASHPELSESLRESHPELIFELLRSKSSVPLSRKNTLPGVKERLSILSKFRKGFAEHYESVLRMTLRKDIHGDDIIDSFALACSAMCASRKAALLLPPYEVRDELGRTIRIEVGLPKKALSITGLFLYE